MFSTSKKENQKESEQREQYVYASERIEQKKGLLSHFIYFIAGSIILCIINLVLAIGIEITFLNYNWFVWVTVLWGFIFLTHVFNVFIKNRFMGKEWEHRQLEKLKALQEKRILELGKKVNAKTPLLEDLNKEKNLAPNKEI